jgi:hypothetical protein
MQEWNETKSMESHQQIMDLIGALIGGAGEIGGAVIGA